MVQNASPQPHYSEDAGDDTAGVETRPVENGNSDHAEEVCRDLRRPNGLIVGGEDIEELIERERKQGANPRRRLQ